jgi:hypothetical protein
MRKTIIVFAGVLLAILFVVCGKQTNKDNTAQVTTNDATSFDTAGYMQSVENAELETVNEESAITGKIDNGHSCTVTGTATAVDTIMKDTGIEHMKAGDKVTSVLGTEYIVTYNDHARNGNWVEIGIEDTAGTAYRIHSSLSGDGLARTYVYIMENVK